MAKRTSIDDPDLMELLEGIDAGRVALPNFQRDFDWSDSDIRALLATVLNGWPIGSLLLIEGDAKTQDFYDPRPFEFAPALSGIPDTIVLDGQQRLTSLYSALYGKSNSVHAVQLMEGLDWSQIDSVDAALRTYKRRAWMARYSTPKAQWAERLIPTSALRSAADFYAWRDQACESGDDREELTSVYRAHLSGLYRYRVPALIVSRETHPAAVARIFERVNRTGQQLGTFDLMVAKSFTPKFNLRVKWEEAKERHPVLAAFYGDDGLGPLQVLSLRLHEDVRSARVLDLTAGAIHDNWLHAVESLAVAADFARDKLGVLEADWQPYKSLVVVLAAYIMSGIELSAREGELKNWFWSASFSTKYAVGSNTVAVADYRRMLAEEWPKRGFDIDWSLLRDSTKQSSGALHRAFLCAMAAAAAGDGARLTVDSVVVRNVLGRYEAAGGDRPRTHLLTLGFVLDAPGYQISAPFVPAGMQTRSGNLEDLDELLRARAKLLVEFLQKESEGLVRLIADPDSESVGVSD